MIVKKIGFLFSALALVCGASLAQDAPKQTVEGAHKFLGIVLSNNKVFVKFETEPGSYNMGRWSGEYYPHQYRTVKISNEPYYMDAFEASRYAGEKCASTYSWIYETGLEQRTNYGLLSRPETREKLWAEHKSDLHEKTELRIDWSGVAGVKPAREGGSEINVIGFGQIILPTPELATRVQYAMEFLRNACDPTAATGF
jgi:hypothetical protein